MKNLVKYFPYFLLLCFLSSCFTTSKLRESAYTHTNINYNTIKVESKAVQFSFNKNLNLNEPISVINNKQLVVPLLFYNRVDYNFLLNFNPGHQSKIIQEKLIKLLDSAGLTKQLLAKNQTLEIEFEKIPTHVEYIDDGHILFLLVGTIEFGLEGLRPIDNEIVVNMRLLEKKKF
jgi:hypothetical protein